MVHVTITRPLTAPTFPRNLTRVLWAIVATLTAAMYYGFWRPGQLIGDPRTVQALPALLAPVAIAVFAYALAVLISLLWRNKGRMRPVLRPSWGKALCAVIMLGLTPIVVMSGLPWLYGPILFMTLPEITSAEQVFYAVGITAGGLAIWYLVSGLIISGSRSRLLRFGLFALMFWGMYAAHMIYAGFLIFRL